MVRKLDKYYYISRMEKSINRMLKLDLRGYFRNNF